jgi:biopolymer transport protein ExbD
MISANKKNLIGTQDLIAQEMELTPLIDVIFIVIVFLLLTANVRLLSLPVTVPETDDIASMSAADTERMTITVSNDNQGWSIDKVYYPDWLDFKTSVLQAIEENPKLTIALAADQQADVQRFVRVLTLLQQQQVSDAHIIVNTDSN